ncbi:MAG: transposase [Alphaproteobacteria bacterium]|nr:transposase [Alphaproteobacteria bacterium]
MTTGQLLVEFREDFPDEESCVRYLFNRRWPTGFMCGCGSPRHWSLNGRAHTFECIDCRRQTSIIAGTVMHGSHLTLRKWFYAAHLIATHEGRISARRLQSRLRVAYQTASELKRKLLLTEIPVDSEPLWGRIEVAQTEITFKFHHRHFGEMLDKRVVVIALELPKIDPKNLSRPPGVDSIAFDSERSRTPPQRRSRHSFARMCSRVRPC